MTHLTWLFWMRKLSSEERKSICSKGKKYPFVCLFVDHTPYYFCQGLFLAELGNLRNRVPIRVNHMQGNYPICCITSQATKGKTFTSAVYHHSNKSDRGALSEDLGYFVVDEGPYIQTIHTNTV